MVSAVVQFQSADVLACVLKETGSEILITRAVLMAAFRNRAGLSPELIHVLLEKHKDVTKELSRSVLVAAVGVDSNCPAETLQTLLSHFRQSAPITEAVLVAAIDLY